MIGYVDPSSGSHVGASATSYGPVAVDCTGWSDVLDPRFHKCSKCGRFYWGVKTHQCPDVQMAAFRERPVDVDKTIQSADHIVDDNKMIMDNNSAWPKAEKASSTAPAVDRDAEFWKKSQEYWKRQNDTLDPVTGGPKMKRKTSDMAHDRAMMLANYERRLHLCKEPEYVSDSDRAVYAKLTGSKSSEKPVGLSGVRGLGMVEYELNQAAIGQATIRLCHGTLHFKTTYAYSHFSPPPGGEAWIKEHLRRELHEYLRKIVMEEDEIVTKRVCEHIRGGR